MLTGIGHRPELFLSDCLERAGEIYPQLAAAPGRPVRCWWASSAERTAMVIVSYGIQGENPDKRNPSSIVRGGGGFTLRRLWAQKKLAHLMIHQKANEKEIAALGKAVRAGYALHVALGA